MLALDLLWLGVVMREFYKRKLGGMMREQPLIVPAVLFYVVFAVGLTWFAVLPALQDGSWQRAMATGAAFGFFAYFTYDVTNYVTLRNFPLTLVVADILWGTAVSAVAAAAAFFAGRLVPG
jgi:uncharacterized membrane protein